MQTSGRPTRVKALTRAFGLLEIVGVRDGIRLSDLASAAGLPLPTARRLLETMSDLGYLYSDASGRWRLGAHATWLGQQVTRTLASAAAPVLRQLVDEVGETAGLAFLEADHVVFACVERSSHAMRADLVVGDRALPHATGTGLALLAQLSDVEVRLLVGRTGLPALTGRTITEVDVLLGELARIRRQRHVVEDGRAEAGMRCVAAAVPGMSPPGAVSVCGPPARLPLDAGGVRVTDAVREAAARLAVACPPSGTPGTPPDTDHRAFEPSGNRA